VTFSPTSNSQKLEFKSFIKNLRWKDKEEILKYVGKFRKFLHAKGQRESNVLLVGKQALKLVDRG